MKQSEWARNETLLACKQENPDYNLESFDYGCACYNSALKAYEILANDGHSGYSFNITKNILIRLMNGMPLTPITDEDFADAVELQSSESLRIDGLKSYKQCPRMSSLFRRESLEGDVYYNDINRCYGIEIEDESKNYTSRYIDDIVNELYPLTMPYMPLVGKYKIYTDTFLYDLRNGDYDTKGLLYLVTPNGERIELNKYTAEKDGKFVDISEDEYTFRKSNRVIINEN